MKKLTCRKCGGTLFKFKKNDSRIKCFKCNSNIMISDFNDKNISNINHITISWKDSTN
ncbi:hypothetical protein [Paramaledivibacter caminithermalis]|jgi:DNA-directed RNA polymerase subunit RPC12/RpoP|uniref:Uncharacterized protein n=1 Tax=Paramaledivibacter caminithermalis (strain DSM 15212 / CIP 107654 / DViRD3) TaxID=1121301 RepID=A0A1M6SXR6_PARC5|nr:hypothetical protein [Paramaledivibacter caminithermalis]SHK49459.1 hypothetical protein SAMN02745912_03471 [Paramaledivibacter caminithermalis DSM 15212]